MNIFNYIQKIKYLAGLAVLLYLLAHMSPSFAVGDRKAQIRWTAMSIDMAGDVNRDGLINVDATYTKPDGKQVKTDLAQKPYLMWINDDDDYSDKETDGHDIPNSFVKDGVFVGTYDHNNSGIDGTRDLIDFFPVGINLYTLLQGFDTNPSILDSITSALDRLSGKETKFASNNYEFLLRQEDEAVNVVFTAMTMSQANDYLIDTRIADDQKKELLGDWHEIFGNDLDDILTERATIEGLEIPADFIQHVKNTEGSGVILLEGVLASDKPLQLILKNKHTDEETTLGQIALSVNSVTDFYRYVNLRGVETTPPAITVEAALAAAPEPVAFKDTNSNGKHMFAMHGYNVSEESAQGWAAEAFKRMWQSGSNSMFTFVTWNGNEGQILGAATPNYWINVVNAFNTSGAMAALVDNLPGTSKTIMAHSLGNMVVSDAIHNKSMNVNHYLMTDAAVAVEAYDARVDQAVVNAMANPVWREYLDPSCDIAACAGDTSVPSKPNNRWLWATEWYKYFDVADPRYRLTWREKFKNMSSLTSVHNFYSSTEDVLENGNGQGTTWGALLTAWEAGLNAWYQQEIAKGTDLYITAIAAGVLTSGEDSYGGWGFNTADHGYSVVFDFDYSIFDLFYLFPVDIRPKVPDVAFALNTADIQLTTFFGKFKSEYHYLYGNSVVDIAADDVSNILAHAMPALSFAAGRNPFTITGYANYNMSVIKDGGNWPAERVNSGDNSWKHSDLKDIAYLYTYPVYQEYVRIGGLR